MRRLTGFFVPLILLCVAGSASAQEFMVDAERQVPYKNYKFAVQWDGRSIPGITEVSALHWTTRTIRSRPGSGTGPEGVSPGTTRFAPVTLVRGRTHDTSFEDWADRIHNQSAGPGGLVSLADYRKNILIDVMNEAGQVVLRYVLNRCWPSEYEPISALDSREPETLTETLVLQCESFARDQGVAEPAPPSF